MKEEKIIKTILFQPSYVIIAKNKHFGDEFVIALFYDEDRAKYSLDWELNSKGYDYRIEELKSNTVTLMVHEEVQVKRTYSI